MPERPEHKNVEFCKWCGVMVHVEVSYHDPNYECITCGGEK